MDVFKKDDYGCVVGKFGIIVDRRTIGILKGKV